MRTIAEMRYGSHLYGTATPDSDVDFKAVHVPAARDILLGRVRESIVTTTKSDAEAKNSAADIDHESYALHKFLRLCAEGQIVALDMLFAPGSALTAAPDRLWWSIQWSRDHLLSKQVRGFLGYCRQQANKYGVKGSRVAATRKVRDFLAAHPPTLKMAELDAGMPGGFSELFADAEHVAVVDVEIRGQDRTVPHLEVCNRKIPFTARVKEGHAIASRLFDEYGKRALAAEREEGIDWKALSHAVRVGREAVELLTEGTITFPRPERRHLIAIKRGELPYARVASEIEALLLVDIEAASARSPLPDKPDHAWIDDFVADTYRQAVLLA